LPEVDYFKPELVDGTLTERLDWYGEKYRSTKVTSFDRGQIVYFSTNSEVCDSWVLIPGAATLPTAVTSIAYCLTLIYLFLGIGIISDIFMSAIEKITAQ
jgi:hypothetical protein